MITPVERCVREAAEAALLLAASMEARLPAGAEMAVMAVYGDRLSLTAWAAPAEVVAMNATPQGRAAVQAVAEHVATAVGAVLGEVLCAHSLALTRLAQVSGLSREDAVAELLELARGGA